MPLIQSVLREMWQLPAKVFLCGLQQEAFCHLVKKAIHELLYSWMVKYKMP